MKTATTDYDSAWKAALEYYLPQSLALFFPRIYADIDWTKGFEFLNKELQKVVREAKVGKRFVDNLVKVWSKDGAESLVFIHIEVQSQVDHSFAKRMYNYHNALSFRYDNPVVSLAILGDEDENWRPKEYYYDYWDCGYRFWFPMVKLIDFHQRWDELENSNNPFSLVVMAYLKAQETKGDMESRFYWKFLLVRWLYERGFRKEDVLNVFRFIDWMIVMTEDMEQKLKEKIEELEEENQMTYITNVERIARKEGKEEGKEEGTLLATQESLITVLRTRFGQPSHIIAHRLQDIQNVDYLKILLEKAIVADTLNEFEQNLN